ncbi:hypothetical protein KDH_71410 [Dictyobacter sp. S3.2.2.5]|uniref:Uncharacterized protein n=1 Tax=Dictyobacter halimunensis TaxID=3026934 RepID=A0ABQ6G2J3_9CHLR|nr:hypothetical protein KDH_71410 [Dictyobacter sp. S3.2.2.5]
MRGLPPLSFLAARKCNKQDAMHRMQPSLVALKELFLEEASKRGQVPHVL